MSEIWEQIRPSWKKVSREKPEETPRITLTRSKSNKERRGDDRISLNKTALKRLNISTSRKCHLLIQSKSRIAGIRVLDIDHLTQNPTDSDYFTLSVSKTGVSIRKVGLFDLMGIPRRVSSLMEKIPYRTDLTFKEGLFIFKLPDKETGTFIIENIEIPDDHDPDGDGIPTLEDAELSEVLNDM
jgi:hypothetical protein